MEPDSFVMLAPVCATWGLPNRGTSKRSFLNPFGNVLLPSVRDANSMMSRTLHVVSTFMNMCQDHPSLRAGHGQQLRVGLGAARELTSGEMEAV